LPSSSPSSSTRGEKTSLPISFLLRPHCRTHNLAGAAASPPSGGGRRRGTGIPLDSPVTCACSPRYALHQLVVNLVAGSTVQRLCRRVFRRTPPDSGELAATSHLIAS
jgi:hypothetical protein